MKLNSILEAIGTTPHLRLNRLFPGREVWAKLERQNPGGSIKDRIALAMVEDAERAGIIKKDTVLIEPTSGNTGVGLAMVAAVKGYRLILVMPESMSVERRRILKAYGAELELTGREKGMKGSLDRANELKASIPNAWIPSQFDNLSNIEAHKRTTAQEILRDFPDGIDYLITGVGTGGHITACAEILKPVWPRLKVFAVEPDASPIISGGQPAPHRIQGLGANFIPTNLHQDVLDGVIRVTDSDAFDWTRRMAKEEGVLVGISSGAALAAVLQKLPEIAADARVLTFNYDTGERYLSIEDLF